MPQNEVYYHVAYTVAAVVYVLYGASLWWRGRALARREAELGLRHDGAAERGR
ncbi:MAG TPA: hypothetical protein VFS08_20825 [Gemmatimonadaceae bacterium]|nr:hypothetical protein [Gemmatimonadaceae bacterium]